MLFIHQLTRKICHFRQAGFDASEPFGCVSAAREGCTVEQDGTYRVEPGHSDSDPIFCGIAKPEQGHSPEQYMFGSYPIGFQYDTSTTNDCGLAVTMKSMNSSFQKATWAKSG
jgi:hypothetical protein